MTVLGRTLTCGVKNIEHNVPFVHTHNFVMLGFRNINQSRKIIKQTHLSPCPYLGAIPAKLVIIYILKHKDNRKIKYR